MEKGEKTNEIINICLVPRVVNIFIFFKKRSFRYENEDENRKIVFLKSSYFKHCRF